MGGNVEKASRAPEDNPDFEEDPYYAHEVQDRVTAIYNKKGAAGNVVDLKTTNVNPGAILQEALAKHRQKEEDLILKREKSHESSNVSASSSGSDDEGLVVGVYHKEREILTKDEEQPELLSESHPVVIEGVAGVGEMVTMRDCSDWKIQFPVESIRWHLSRSVGDDERYDTVLEADGDTLEIPYHALGHYIRVTATRNVQDTVLEAH